MDELQSYLYSEHSGISERYKKKIRILRGLAVFLCTAAAVALYFFHIRLPLVPKMFVTELSALPELLLTFAYGPLYGIAACLVKNAVHMLVMGNTMIPDTANFITESVFLLAAGALFAVKTEETAHKTERPVSRGERLKWMLGGALAGMAAALVAQFGVTLIYVYPSLTEKYSTAYSTEILLQAYQTTVTGLRAHLPAALASLLPDIHSLWQGVLMVNLPITLVKLCVVTLLTVAAYNLLLRALHVKIPKSENQI